MHRLNPLFWLAAFFVWALCAGGIALLTALALYYFRPRPEQAEDEWEAIYAEDEGT